VRIWLQVLDDFKLFLSASNVSIGMAASVRQGTPNLAGN
jgi:hypothetical protein